MAYAVNFRPTLDFQRGLCHNRVYLERPQTLRPLTTGDIIMPKRLFPLLLIGLLCLSALGCHREDSPASTEGATTADHAASDTESAPPAVEINVLSPLAMPDYLTPQEDYSWTREVAPEFIMLHFSSNVVVDRENPYGLDAVRSIFIENGVSTHYLIDRDGTIYGYVPENRVAWHAGKGSYADDDRLTDNMNHYAIGIELMAIGSREDMAKYLTSEEYDALDPSLIGYTEAQYAALAVLLPDICSRYDIPFDREHIIGHQDYRPAKPDPGELFDWERVVG